MAGVATPSMTVGPAMANRKKVAPKVAGKAKPAPKSKRELYTIELDEDWKARLRRVAAKAGIKHGSDWIRMVLKAADEGRLQITSPR